MTIAPAGTAEARVEALLAIGSKRFPDLPPDCGREVPGILEVAEWHDWTHRPTTPDQQRIEDYLDQLDPTGRSILHIGIGNSGLAVRFAQRAAKIVGTSVEPAEIAHGRELGIPNYSAVLHNKHAGPDDLVSGQFDFIVDNNPTSFCCCVRHLAALLELYRSRLAPEGEVVTDRSGLAWTLSSRPGSRSFNLADLARIARPFNLRAYCINKDIYVLRHESAPPPSLRVRARTSLQQLRSMVRARLRPLTHNRGNSR